MSPDSTEARKPDVLTPAEAEYLIDVAWRIDEPDELQVNARQRRQVAHALKEMAKRSPADYVEALQRAGTITNTEEADAYYQAWLEAVTNLDVMVTILDRPYPDMRDWNTLLKKSRSARVGTPRITDPLEPGGDPALLLGNILELLRP